MDHESRRGPGSGAENGGRRGYNRRYSRPSHAPYDPVRLISFRPKSLPLAMSNDESPTPGDDLPSGEDLARVNEVCERFELEWMQGQRPRIEDYLKQAAMRCRGSLLRELL